jgi:hypothetical protein
MVRKIVINGVAQVLAGLIGGQFLPVTFHELHQVGSVQGGPTP